jgi:hypothetical protein
MAPGSHATFAAGAMPMRPDGTMSGKD